MRKLILLGLMLLVAGCAGGHPVFVMSYDLLAERLDNTEKYTEMVHEAMLADYVSNLGKVDGAILGGLVPQAEDGKVTLAQVGARLTRATDVRNKILENRRTAEAAYRTHQENVRIMRNVIADGRSLALYLSDVREQWKSYLSSATTRSP